MTKYKLVDHPNGFHNEHWCVEIEEGQFTGVVYQYDTINFNEIDEGGDAVLKFNTITVSNPNEEDLTDEEFSGIIGDILVKIIAERMDESEEENAGNTSNTEELNT